jgi:hypothetical protein
MAERSQDVIGSDDRCHLPNNHSKYRTSGVPVLTGTPVKLQRDHGGTRIEPPDSLTGQAIHLRAWRGEEHAGRPGRLVGRDPRQDDLPHRRLKPQGVGPVAQLDDLDHVDPVRQGRIEPLPDVRRNAPPGEG